MDKIFQKMYMMFEEMPEKKRENLNKDSFISGFMACERLNLPVHFFDWMWTICKEYFRGGTYSIHKELCDLDPDITYTTYELYQYWLNNVHFKDL